MVTTAAASPAVAAAVPAVAGTELRAFKPVADTYVTAARPRANFGHARVLRVDGQPAATTYLRFRVGRLKDDVETVTLLLHASAARAGSYEVRSVDDDDWRERDLTFENQPRRSVRYAASRPVRQGAWSAVDVTAFFADEGDISLAITTRGKREVVFHSRESTYGPRLVVRTEDNEGPGSGGDTSGLPSG